MNKIFNNKNLAFTLAEMMVVLTLFSVISAATLPVITAQNKVDMSEDSTASGYFPDPWMQNDTANTLSYYNAKSPFADKEAVIIGGKISEDAYALGFPQLIVRNNNSQDLAHSSQIELTKSAISGGNTGIYNGGRIMMNSNINVNYGNSIALGNFALVGKSVNSIGIGGLAGNFSGSTDSFAQNSVFIGNFIRPASRYRSYSSVAMGKNSLLSIENNGAAYSSVAIGDHAFYSSAASVYDDSVAMGTFAGAEANSTDTVSLGYYAGFSNQNIGNVNIGYYSGNFPSTVGYNVSLGSYADYSSMNGITSNVAIGFMSGAYLNNHSGLSAGFQGISIGYYAMYGFGAPGEVIRPIAIGSYAGSGVTFPNSSFRFESAPIMIGYKAGNGVNILERDHLTNFVAIGSYALYANENEHKSASTVAIGTYAGFEKVQTTNEEDLVLLGTYSGAFTSSNLRSRSVCIGYNACYGAYGSNDVRIAPYSPTSFNYPMYEIQERSDPIQIEGGVNYLRDGISYIGYGYAPPNLNIDVTYTNKFAEKTTSHLIISPLSYNYDEGNTTGHPDFIYSSIVLFAEHAYGPQDGIYTFSDRRLKENIRPLKYGLKDVRKINIYEYKWKNNDISTPQIGVIAQELQKIMPESVYTSPKGFLAVSSDWPLFAMLNAVQELDKSILSIQNEFKAYVKEYISLVSRVKVLEKEVKVLEKENKTLEKDINIAYGKAKKLEAKGR